MDRQSITGHISNLSILGNGETEAAELTSQMIGRTIREWKSKFFESGGEIPDSQQGHY